MLPLWRKICDCRQELIRAAMHTGIGNLEGSFRISLLKNPGRKGESYLIVIFNAQSPDEIF